MKLSYLLIVLLAVLVACMSGCDTGDIWADLSDASGYISVVGNNMQARGYDFFPDNVIAWSLFVSDLRASITNARSKGVLPSGVVRDIERGVMTTPEPDMQSLGKAFEHNGDW